MAGGDERCRDAVHAGFRRAARSRNAATRSAASAVATLTGATFCRPDQAGMLFTSSTVGFPSAPNRMSTPAKEAPTAVVAATARFLTLSSATAASGRPPRFTLVIHPGERRAIV